MSARLDWIDALKGFAIIAVVFGHCTGGALAANAFPNDHETIQTIHNFIYSFHMPLFFSASGFLFYLTKSYTKYKIRVTDMALMYTFWVLITWLIKYSAGSSINYPVTVQTLITNIYNPTFIYWYLYSLMLLYLFYSISGIKIITSKTLMITSILACCIKLFAPSIGVLNNTIYFAHFFAMGGYLHSINFHKLPNKAITITSAAFVAFNIFLFINNIPLNNELAIIKNFTLANAAIVISYYIFIKLKHFKMLELFGVYSLHIYLMHDFLVAGTRMLFIKFGFQNFWLFSTLGIILGISLPIIIGKFCENKGILNFPFAPLNTLKSLRSTK